MIPLTPLGIVTALSISRQGILKTTTFQYTGKVYRKTTARYIENYDPAWTPPESGRGPRGRPGRTDRPGGAARDRDEETYDAAASAADDPTL